MDDTKLPWHVYLLTCADGTLYCGVTNDLARRLAEHNAGTGAKYTRSRLPVTLTASAPFADRSTAQAAEAVVKARPRAGKVDYLLALAAAPRFGQPDPAQAPEASKAQAAPEKKPRAVRAPRGKASAAPKAAPKAGGRAAKPAAAPAAPAPVAPQPEAAPTAAAAPKPKAGGRKVASRTPESQPAATPAAEAAAARAKTPKGGAQPREAMPEASPAPRARGRAATPKAAPEAQAPVAPKAEAAPKSKAGGRSPRGAAPAPEAQPAAPAKPPTPAPAKPPTPAPAPEAAAPSTKDQGRARAVTVPAPEGEAPAPGAKGRDTTRGEAPAPAPKATTRGEVPAPAPRAEAAPTPAREPRPKAKKVSKARPAVAEAVPVVCAPPRDLLDRRLAPRRAVADVEPLRGKITKEDIGLLPLGAWCGEIVIVDTPRAAEAAARDMRTETVLGFDTESRPAFMKGRYYLPSLIQMATTETVYIYMLGRLAFPESLMAIFEEPGIIKTGVAVRDDVKDLQRIVPFAARGFIDLGVVALHHKLDTHGLRNLAAKFLGIRISKAARCTNWANPRLTPAQINYAATDAWISRELFLAMDREGLIDPARDYDNGNGVPEQAKDSKTRARVRRGGRSRRR